MKITSYLINNVQLEVRSNDYDEWGQYTYSAPETIRARVTAKVKIVITDTGREIVDYTAYMTEREVKPGDRIDGNEIQAVRAIVDFKKTIGYTAYVTPNQGFSS